MSVVQTEAPEGRSAASRAEGSPRALRLIVCDWNGTLFREELEQTFFFGLCRRAVWRAVRRFNVRAMARLALRGMRCLAHYLAARRHPRLVTHHIGCIMALLEPDVLHGLTRDELAAYTQSYAQRIQGHLDRRLLDPLAAAREESGVRLGVISAGCREGIAAALAAEGTPFNFIEANEFTMDGDVTDSFDFALADNKHAVLVGLLALRNVDPAGVMFIGDSPQDEECLRAVGYPVVSFFASDSRKRQLAADCGAFVPADQADFARYLAAAINPK